MYIAVKEVIKKRLVYIIPILILLLLFHLFYSVFEEPYREIVIIIILGVSVALSIFIYKKLVEETNLLNMVFSEINDNLDISVKLSPKEIGELVEFIDLQPPLRRIHNPLKNYVSRFRPTDVDKRMTCLSTLSLIYENFLGKIHELHPNQNIKNNYRSRLGLSLGELLNEPWNVFYQENWFLDYKINRIVDNQNNLRIRKLKQTKSKYEFDTNGEILITNKYTLDRNLVRLLITSLCRNLHAHIKWTSEIWVREDPYIKTIKLILEMYLITWKYEK